MNLSKFFQARSKRFYLFLVVLGLLSSMTNIGVLMLINNALGGKTLPFLGHYPFLAFIILIAISFTASLLFQTRMVRLSNDIMYGLELKLIGKMRSASFESFESLGSEKVYAAIGDTRVLARIPEVFVTLINSSVTIVCSLLYFFWVSPIACGTVLGLMGILLLIYIKQNRRTEKDLNKLRDLQDNYYQSLREMVSGFKQIRISTRRNDTLFQDHIFANKQKSKQLSVKTAQRYIFTELGGNYSWYLVLGFVIFLLPVILHISIAQLAAFITTILFMIGPVSQLIMFVPFYTSFKIAIERINKVEALLETDAQGSDPSNILPPKFSSIRFEDIRYHYSIDEDNVFLLDLMDLRIVKDEIVFIIGGNGSGKTTFIHLLTGLCKPLSGRIYIDDVEVSWEQFRTLGNHMAVVYTNHHLFLENYDGFELSENNASLSFWRDTLNLRGILKIHAGKNRIETHLSKGQQKRVALLLALLENKPILILDEWAAEQDPQNRKCFYTEWLELIRSMGKTVIAITHDDEYYHVADRIVKFSQGAVVSDSRRYDSVSI